MLQVVPHRHTHRGAFEPVSLTGDPLARLQDDDAAEGATLAVVDGGRACQRLTGILGAWSRRRDLYPAPGPEIEPRAETQRWTRESGSQARDGVPAHAFPATGGHEADACRSATSTWDGAGGFRPSGGPPAPVIAILVTSGGDEENWLRVGQALQRLLLRAAS